MENYNQQRISNDTNPVHRAYDIIMALVFGVVITLGVVFLVRLFFFLK